MATPVDAWDSRFATFRRVAQAAARDPRVRALASRLANINELSPSLADARRLVSLSPADLRKEQCAMLLRAVQSRVSYLDDAPMVTPNAGEEACRVLSTWARGEGDCKDSAVLLCALALAVGCNARLLAMGWDGAPSHVACQLRPTPASPWLWAETTLPAELGEHPSDALERSDVARRDFAPRRGAIGSTSPPNSVNDAIVNEARAVVGLYADTNLAEFKDLVAGPNETEATKTKLAMGPSVSTCGLVAGGIWRRAGIRHPSLDPPYRVASAIGRLIWDIAIPLKAWETHASYEPNPGDLLGLDLANFQGNGHVATIVSVARTPNGWTLGTVDGGAVDAGGAQGVASRVHHLTIDEHGIASVNSLGVEHRVTGFVNVAKLRPLQSLLPSLLPSLSLSSPSSLMPWLVGGGAVVAAGGVVYFATRRKRAA